VHLVAHCRKPPTTGETLPPNRYDIKGTSAISDQASNVAMVWFNKAKRQALQKNAHDEAELAKPDALIVIDKQRHGTFEGKLALWFDERSLRFCDTRTAAVEPYNLQAAA
jgi:twinkle protein